MLQIINNMITSKKHDIVIFLGLLLYVTFFTYLYWDLPIHEDNGYYAFLSKAMSSGSILHIDIPAQTNGIILYLIAFLFQFTGIDIHVYKGVHLFFHFGLGWIFYLLLRNYISPYFAFIVTLVVMIFLGLPSIAFDMGRNPIEIALFFIFLGIYYFHKQKSIFLFAFFLGCAALVRETFLIVPLVVLATYIKQYFWIERTKIYTFVLGLMIALSINALILTYYGSWSEYFFDMLHSGTGFRYGHGFFSWVRIRENIKMLIFGYSNYPLIIFFVPMSLGFMSYKFDFRDKTIDLIKFIIFPTFIFEAIFINKTADYSIFPMLTIATFLAGLAFARLETPKVKKSIVLGSVATFIGIVGIYYNYFYYSQSVLSHKMNNVDPNRLVDVINRIPHKTIAAFSEYPALFLSKNMYNIKYPYVEDLSASYNLGRPQMRIDQLNKMKINPPDIYIDKTTDLYLSKEDELGKILDQNYYKIADFGINSKDKFYGYKERVLISKALLTTFSKTRSIHIDSKAMSKIQILRQKNTIAKIDSNTFCAQKLILQNDESNIGYNLKESDNSVLMSFVKKNMNLHIINTSGTDCSIEVTFFEMQE